MYTQEEKILILGSLFHDIGKFEQRCTGNSERKTHQYLGGKLADDLKTEFVNILDKNEESFNRMKKIILEHHNKNLNDELVSIVQKADHISAGERVQKESNEEMGEDWSHKYLSSLFSKITLLSEDSSELRYYKQVELTKGNYDAMIPLEKAQAELEKYNVKTYSLFFEDIQNVFRFYEKINDFDTLINMILIVFEKYLWCIPDFTGSPETDISLYNHLKDVCGLSLTIFKSSGKKLNLVIGDIPGIQDYIFDVVNKKPAKILRGRSINVQVLTRNFATKFLNEFGISEANLVMFAGGKFYIIAPDSNDFKSKFENSCKAIDEYLAIEYNFELHFNFGYHSFVYEDLIKKDKDGKRMLTFGDVIEKSTENLNSNRYKLFRDKLNPSLADNYVLNYEYIKSNGDESDNIKCKVTDKPIIEGRRDEIHDKADDEKFQVDKNVKTEYKIGHQIVESNLVLEMGLNSFEVVKCEIFKDYVKNGSEKAIKVLINPNLEELLKSKTHISFFTNMRFFEVANYTSGKENVMSFEEMSKDQNGAKYLSLIKGDIDNLGMIMAYGLHDDENDKTGISRTTTLSNHLKYYFSFFMNGFLKFIDEKGIIVNGKEFKSNSYVIFAGGDDLMIVCPQTKSLELLNEFNSKFDEFVCKNPEVHISYSITNFNHSTPIRIVSEISEENQKEAKKSDDKNVDSNNICDWLVKDTNFFKSEKNKATTLLFNTRVKNDKLNELLNLEEQYFDWHENEPQKISMGVIRNTLRLTEIMKEWREKGDTSKLIWHPYLSYMINRLLKRDGKYKHEEIGKLYDEILSINKTENIKEIILYPALCGVIYKLRRS